MLLRSWLACVPAVPPATHFTPVTAGTTVTRQSTSVDVGSIGPSLAVTHTRPVAKVPVLAPEVRAQGSLSHGQIGLATWFRTNGARHDGLHFGTRLGADVGTGDISGFLPWSMPFVGGSLHLQGAGGFGAGERGAWAISLGGEWQQPIAPNQFSTLVEDADGVVSEVIPIHAVYSSLDARVDLPVDQRVAVSLGVMGQLLFPAALPVVKPTVGLSAGLRF